MALTSREHLLPPGVCILCEQAPDEEAVVVDTNANLNPGFPFALAGRKYICESCLKAYGAEIGLTSDEAQAENIRTREIAEGQLTAVISYVRDFAAKVSDGELESVAASATIAHSHDEGIDFPHTDGLQAAIAAGNDPGVAADPTHVGEPDGAKTPAAQVVPEDTHVEADNVAPAPTDAVVVAPAAQVVPQESETATLPPAPKLAPAPPDGTTTVETPVAQVDPAPEATPSEPAAPAPEATPSEPAAPAQTDTVTDTNAAAGSVDTSKTS